MRVSFAFPSSSQRTGGVVVLYELANALARRGHEVHFLHGPASPHRVDRLEDLPASVRFEPSLHHHLIDRIDDPGLPETDVLVFPQSVERLGLPVGVVQGWRMLTEAAEVTLYRQPFPKVCVARWLVDIGVDLGVPEEQLWHVPNGLDHDLFRLLTPLDGRPYDVAMLFHPHREKGPDVGLAAIRELCRRRPGLRAVVFGVAEPPGPLPDGVDFLLGPDQPTLVRGVYNATRVFLQSSRHEGFGYTAVEAMACGAALVTTDNGGSRDYAFDGDTALVVPPDEPLALADAAASLLDDDDRRRYLATRGEQSVRRFDWDRSGALLEAHLEAYVADPVRFQRPYAPLPDHEEVG